jgi:hypothetical protein
MLSADVAALPQERQPLGVAEAIARDLPRPMPLEDPLKLVHLYAEKESPKYERAAMKGLRPSSLAALEATQDADSFRRRGG